MRINDRENLYFVQDGQKVSFADVYERHWKLLCSIGDKITKDEEMTHDLVQEVFISLLEKSESKELSNITGYLVRAMKFKCLAWLRDAKVEQRHLSKMEHVKIQNTIESSMDAAVLQEKLDLILSDMPSREQEIFRLSRFEDLSTDEIASRLNLNKRTVENYLSKAVQTLRLTLKSIPIIIFLGFF